MRYVLDRLEGNHAVLECENGKSLIVLRNELPLTAKEGDIIKLVNNIYVVDVKETDDAKNRISEKMKKLLKK